MKDRTSQRMDLIGAVFAFVAFTVTDTVVAGVEDAAVNTGRHVAIGLFEHVVEAGRIVWKPLVELFDCERLTHIFSLLQRLHVVKG